MQNKEIKNNVMNVKKPSNYEFEDFENSENEERYRYFKNGKVQKIED